eukprot:TRINITY_DN8081_c0_g1_i1.p1 TRINITY_DN8081_c0_g1~~TRINITY_DN8081_c0_g1_i1.p1  ORF type:complete len:861 (+),score=299.88 TRINITY_DN8081_c0_g1_i1:170-2752(+)
MEEYIYVDESFPDELICKICKKGYRNPCITKCGHSFCAECMEGWILVKKEDVKCPECDIPLKRENISSSYKVEAKLEELKVYCSNKDKGCQWQDKRKKLSHHIQTNCKFIPKLLNKQSPEMGRKSPPIKSTTSRSNLMSTGSSDYLHLKKNVNTKKTSLEEANPYDKSQMRVLLHDIEEMIKTKLSDYKYRVDEQNKLIEMYESQKKLSEEEVKIFRESNERLQTKINELNKEKTMQLEKSNMELNNLKNTLNNNKLESRKSEDNLEKYMNVNRRLEDAEKMIIVLKNENESIKKDTLIESEQWRVLVEKSRRELDREIQKYSELKDKNTKTEKLLKESSDKENNHKSEIVKLNNQLEQVNNKMKQLDQQLDTKSNNEILQEQIEKKSKENLELNDKISKLQDQLTEVNKQYDLVMKTNDTRIVKIERTLYNVIKQLKTEKEKEGNNFRSTIKSLTLELQESKKMIAQLERNLQIEKNKSSQKTVTVTETNPPHINDTTSHHVEEEVLDELPIEDESEIIEDNVSVKVPKVEVEKEKETEPEPVKKEPVKVQISKRVSTRSINLVEKPKQPLQQNQQQQPSPSEEKLDLRSTMPNMHKQVTTETPVTNINNVNLNNFNNSNNPNLKLAQNSFDGIKKVILELKEREKQNGTENFFEKKYPEDFIFSLIEFINNKLKDDPKVKNFIPFAYETSELPNFYYACSTGIILCKLLMALIPKSIEEQAIQYQTGLTMSKWNRQLNVNLVYKAGLMVGCVFSHIPKEDIVYGTPDAIIEMIWQIIKAGLSRLLKLTNKRGKFQVVLKDEEKMFQILSWNPETIVLRWVCYCLSLQGHKDKTINGFSDLVDGFGLFFCFGHFASYPV